MSDHALHQMQKAEARHDAAWQQHDEPQRLPVYSGDGQASEPPVLSSPVSLRRPIADILADLAEPVHTRHLETKTLKGHNITFIPWHRACRILDFYTAGFWNYEIREKAVTGSHFLITIRVIIHGCDGTLYREGTGLESLSVDSYGDPSSNAEAMAFRRACAKFGLGLHLYEEKP